MPDSALDIGAMLGGRPALLRDACERALAYLDQVADRPVAPAKPALTDVLEPGFPLPRQGGWSTWQDDIDRSIEAVRRCALSQA